MIRKLLLVAAATATALPLVATAPAQATILPRPGQITAVTAKPGPRPGQVTFYWRQDGSHTTSFRIETGLTSFAPHNSALPAHGRQSRVFAVGANRRSVTLSAAQVSSAGAPMRSANHLYYRIWAVNRTQAGKIIRYYPYLQSVGVKHRPAPSTGTPLRVASFNVRTARATTDAHGWLERAPWVASTILSHRPGVVALQELGPGRADGALGTTTGHTRQTVSLENALRAQGGGRYQLVRTTPYVAPGVKEGTQGSRILYDTNRYRLVSHCPETTDGRPYSPSCSFMPPKLPGDSATHGRRAAYAVLEDRASGKRFYVVSVHLDQRQSSNLATEHRYEQLRGDQVRAVLGRINRLNTRNLPVVFAGDLNSWQNNKGGYKAHDALVANGFFDTAAAETRIHPRYTTSNGFDYTIKRSPSGWGARLDVIAVKGIRAASRWENVMKVTDSTRPSDHNMIVTDFRMP